MMWMRGETLGMGASATVSLAVVDDHTFIDRHHLPSSIMAVKSARLSKSRPLRRERRLLKVFESCPHVLRCFGDEITVEKGEKFYNMFLEYASKGSLVDHIHDSTGGLPESEVRKHTRSTLMGLSYIHKRGYVHCDIKPHNILLVERETESDLSKSPLINLNGKRKRVVERGVTAKIADFGLTMKAGEKPEEGESNGLRGTPMYIAPESIQHGEYEAATDIWGLGCTVLQMITGKFPWSCDPNTEKAAILFRIGFSEKLPEIPNGLLKEARDFLQKCLVRDPTLRWTADRLLDHPFVSGADRKLTTSLRDEGKRVLLPKTEKEVVDSAMQSSFNLPKPYLLMKSDALSDGIVPDFSKFRGGKKMKRVDDDEDEKELQFEASFKLDALRRYWGIMPFGVVPESSIAIQIFN